jgi:hypothetical protein
MMKCVFNLQPDSRYSRKKTQNRVIQTQNQINFPYAFCDITVEMEQFQVGKPCAFTCTCTENGTIPMIPRTNPMNVKNVVGMLIQGR